MPRRQRQDCWPIGWQSTLGAGPRFVVLDPSDRFLHAANENADTIVTFAVEARSGKLTPTGQVVKNGSPATIVFTGQP